MVPFRKDRGRSSVTFLLSFFISFTGLYCQRRGLLDGIGIEIAICMHACLQDCFPFSNLLLNLSFGLLLILYSMLFSVLIFFFWFDCSFSCHLFHSLKFSFLRCQLLNILCQVLIMDKITVKIMSYACKMADITQAGVSCKSQN